MIPVEYYIGCLYVKYTITEVVILLLRS